MKQLDILAQWLDANPLPTPMLYAEIQNLAQAQLGQRGTNRYFPALLREEGYFRRVTRHGVWYLRPGETLPDPREQARRYAVS